MQNKMGIRSDPGRDSGRGLCMFGYRRVSFRQQMHRMGECGGAGSLPFGAATGSVLRSAAIRQVQNGDVVIFRF